MTKITRHLNDEKKEEESKKLLAPAKGCGTGSLACGGKRGLCLELLFLFFQEKRKPQRQRLKRQVARHIRQRLLRTSQ
jgi:hypothetical protein